MFDAFPDPRLAHLAPRLHAGVVEFPVYHMRGGTSTGIVLWQRHLPATPELRDELIRHLMGVPLEGELTQNRQITGLGRGPATSNKVFIVDFSEDGKTLISTLAQLAATKSAIDWSVNCGNMSAALPLYALDTGLVQWGPEPSAATLDIFNTNTQTRLSAVMQLQQGRLEANTEIPGVEGAFPGVDLYLHKPVGAKTGRLLPTGAVIDRIAGLDVSCVDVAVPMVIVAAADLGKTGCETAGELDADLQFKARLREIWTDAGHKMELKNRDGSLMTAEQLRASETIPKVCIVSSPQAGGNINARYFTPQQAHASLAVSGGCCLAAACLLPGSVAHGIAAGLSPVSAQSQTQRVLIENPAGILEARVDAVLDDGHTRIEQAAYRRSAQILLRGSMPLYRASNELKAYLSQ
ncbi:PrpF protein [Paralcaligenes sp. KSB-10]|uniref:PrpF domain-containing protein n=1 Tax=Paralcaligenes sp. KSB-10 TaxID=2901142 RepID=UPI001E435B17|nr:PrpF domain-containing protein [Paralcaligenes sp. KSB-10]UHL65069.1 PrpF protein [Paralcaligenes sp. KSB-10]